MIKFILEIFNSMKHFNEQQEEKCADDCALELEELAAKYEVTVDYLIDEFILD
jgi:hypothetical protein